jgi:hypothetical protein
VRVFIFPRSLLAQADICFGAGNGRRSPNRRYAAGEPRTAAVGAVKATAEVLQSTLEQMQALEDTRRTLCEIRDLNKLDVN